MKLSIAIAQMQIAPNDPVGNMVKMEQFIQAAKKRGADLVVFPEDAICGPLSGQTAFVAEAPGYLAQMQRLAVTYGVDLVPGTWSVSDGIALYNQAHYITSEGIVAGIYHQLPAAYHLAARFPNDFESAVLHAVNGGGENQARAVLTGALVGAQTGLSGIPRCFLEGLDETDILQRLAMDVASKVGASLTADGVQNPEY